MKNKKKDRKIRERNVCKGKVYIKDVIILYMCVFKEGVILSYVWFFIFNDKRIVVLFIVVKCVIKVKF